MNGLNVDDRLRFARRAVAVLRALAASGKKMRYNEFARKIGLMTANERWTAQYRDQTTATLRVVAAVEHYGLGGRDRGVKPLEFDCVVTVSGKPGSGITKNS